jgi:hypothetical protein
MEKSEIVRHPLVGYLPAILAALDIERTKGSARNALPSQRKTLGKATVTMEAAATCLIPMNIH